MNPEMLAKLMQELSAPKPGPMGSPLMLPETPPPGMGPMGFDPQSLGPMHGGMFMGGQMQPRGYFGGEQGQPLDFGLGMQFRKPF